MNKLTIIVPTAGKRWALLERCLTSIVTQSVVPKVICVHNHNSEVPQMPKGAKHICCPGNIYKGFNAGVLESKTEWISLIGDDDYLFDSDWIKNMLIMIKNSGECNYIHHLRLIYGLGNKGVKLVDYAGRELEIPGIVLRRRSGIIPHSGAVYKRDLHRYVGMYPENIECQGDTYWICKAAQSGYLKLKTYDGGGPVIGMDNASRVSRDPRKRREAYRIISKLVNKSGEVSQKVLTQIEDIIKRTDPTINKGVIRALCFLAKEIDKR